MKQEKNEVVSTGGTIDSFLGLAKMRRDVSRGEIRLPNDTWIMRRRATPTKTPREPPLKNAIDNYIPRIIYTWIKTLLKNNETCG